MNIAKLWCVSVLIAAGCVAGCSSWFSDDSIFGNADYKPENLHKTVTALPDGRYRVKFRDPEIIPFGGSNYKASVPRYLEHYRLIPPECRAGIELLSAGSVQGGYYHAALFRCAASPLK